MLLEGQEMYLMIKNYRMREFTSAKSHFNNPPMDQRPPIKIEIEFLILVQWRIRIRIDIYLVSPCRLNVITILYVMNAQDNCGSRILLLLLPHSSSLKGSQCVGSSASGGTYLVSFHSL